MQGPVNGDGFYVIDLKSKKASPIALRYPGITPEVIGERRGMHYKAGDGLDIPAYLTLPVGRPAKALPLIVLVHGGPAARDDPGFDWWAHAIASRGYAVLQPQFRGSDGFGEAHLKAGYGQWGRRMQSDVSDGVRALAAQGVIDPARVCIVGASYGGYAAMAGITLEQGVYRCASSIAGVTDVRQFLTDGRSINKANEDDNRYWQRFAGSKTLADPILDAISPARQAKFAKVPVQLIHGKDDTVVPYEQSTIMERALRKAGVPVEMVTLKAEDHWLSRSATRIQMLEAMVAFLERNNPPAATTATPAP